MGQDDALLPRLGPGCPGVVGEDVSPIKASPPAAFCACTHPTFGHIGGWKGPCTHGSGAGERHSPRAGDHQCSDHNGPIPRNSNHLINRTHQPPHTSLQARACDCRPHLSDSRGWGLTAHGSACVRGNRAPRWLAVAEERETGREKMGAFQKPASLVCTVGG